MQKSEASDAVSVEQNMDAFNQLLFEILRQLTEAQTKCNQTEHDNDDYELTNKAITIFTNETQYGHVSYKGRTDQGMSKKCFMTRACRNMASRPGHVVKLRPDQGML